MDNGERVINKPRPGYFKIRERRGGPFVPALIRWSLPLDPLTGEVMDRSPRLEAFKDGRAVDIDDVWLWGREIGKDEYKWLKAQTALRRL